MMIIAWITLGIAQPKVDRSESLTAVEKRAVLKFLASKQGEAKKHFEAGRYQLAYRFSDSIITLAPEVPFRREVRSLRRAAEARHLGETVLGVGFQPDDRAEFPLEKVTGRFELENISDEVIRVEAAEGAPLGLCEFRVFEVYGDGSHWTTRGSRVIRSAGDFLLERHATHYQPLEVDLQRGAREPILQLIEIRGSFRPKELIVGDQSIARSIPWHAVEIVVLPDDYLALEEDPRAALIAALGSIDSGRVAAAGFLWVRELEAQGDVGHTAREETIDLLIDQLDAETESPLDRLVIQLLEQVVGVEQRPTRATWLRWYGRHLRERGG